MEGSSRRSARPGSSPRRNSRAPRRSRSARGRSSSTPRSPSACGTALCRNQISEATLRRCPRNPHRHRFATGPLTAYDLQKRWVRSGTFNAVLRLHTDFTGAVCISRTVAGNPGFAPPTRCRREGCDRARAPDGMPLKTCARCRSVMYCSPVPACVEIKRHRADAVVTGTTSRRWRGASEI